MRVYVCVRGGVRPGVYKKPLVYLSFTFNLCLLPVFPVKCHERADVGRF